MRAPVAISRGVLAAAAALALPLFGCESLSIPATPQVPTWLHHPGGTLSITYRRPLTAESRQQAEVYERGQPAIDVAGRRVFVPSSDNGLYALRVEDGSTIWRFETMGPVQSEPLFDAVEDVVYFGSNDGAVYKVNATNGRMLWRFATNAEVGRKPVLRNGVLYITNANDTLIAMNAATGALKWHQHRTPAFGMESAGYAGPALGRDKVYTAYSDGVVLAYDLEDGSEQWPAVDLAAEAEQQTGGDTPRYLDVDTTPLVARITSGEVVFVGSYAGGVYALDAENGTRAWVNEKAVGVTELVLWEQPAHAPRTGPLVNARGLRSDEPSSTPKPPSVPGQRILFAASGITGLWALDPNDGRTLWRRNLPEGGITAPVPVAGALLVGTTRYGLFLFSPVTGGLIDGILPGGSFAMTPAAFGVRAFVVGNGGSFLSVLVTPPAPAPADTTMSWLGGKGG
ncbi:MAG TPA: PQQ-binding-like beta-propeller repeat protein [Polyangium sp.]|nr:PQQ-binding-like beta-propeller repeat protein [Polyangium sp.]